MRSLSTKRCSVSFLHPAAFVGGIKGGFCFFLLSISLLFFISPYSSRAEFTLKQYQEWQQYNGWPIRLIYFPGIKTFSRAELLTVMATEKPTWLRRYIRLGSRTTFFADDFASDLIRIENFYHREGFPRATVIGEAYPEPKHEELRLRVEISEGEPLLLSSWTFKLAEGESARIDSARWPHLLPIKIGKRVSESGLKISADTLRHQLRENGHARAIVDYKLISDSTTNTASAEFMLHPGSYCRIGATHVRGLKQLAEGSARRELTYHEYDSYAPSKLSATRKRLLRLEMFRMVRIEPDLETPGDTLAIWVNVEEGNRYFVRFGGGYNSEERFNAHAEFNDLNFFGRSRRFTLETKVSEVGRRVGARLFWPHTPYNATDITLAPAWELKSAPGYTIEKQTGTTILSAAPLTKTSLALSNEAGAERERFTFTDLSTDVRRDSIANYKRSTESISLSWDTRDNPLLAKQGHVLSLTAWESGAFYRIDRRWWRVLLHGRVLVPADRFTTFAAKSEIGIMGPLHDRDVTPRSERFFLGGASSVRGWGKDKLSPRDPDDTETPLGGDLAFHASLEYRRDIWGPVGGILFADAGNVWVDPAKADFWNLYTSAGVGIRFLTPVGPIRTDFGYQLRRNPYGENRIAFYFSLGSPF